MEDIRWSDFEKIELRVGTVTEVLDFPQARKPAYKLHIDFGELGTRWSSAQITHHYTKENLVGKKVMAVVNFPKKQIANFFSECLVAGFADKDGHIKLAIPDGDVPNGAKLI